MNDEGPLQHLLPIHWFSLLTLRTLEPVVETIDFGWDLRNLFNSITYEYESDFEKQDVEASIPG